MPYAWKNVLDFGGSNTGGPNAVAINTALATDPLCGFIAPGTYKVEANVTVAAGKTLLFEPGAVLSLDPTVTLTVAGRIIAGSQQIFSGAGSVVFTNAVEAPVQWWGAVADGTTDDTAAVAATLKAVPADSVVSFPDGRYNLATWIPLTLTNKLTKRLELRGAGMRETVLLGDTGKDFVGTTSRLEISAIGFENWRDLVLLEPATTVEAVTLERVRTESCGRLLRWDTTGSGKVERITINRCEILSSSSYGASVAGAFNSFRFTNNFVDELKGHALQVGVNDYALQDTWENIDISRNTFRNIRFDGAAAATAALVYGRAGTLSDNIIDGVYGDPANLSLENWGIYTKLRYGTINNNVIRNVKDGGQNNIGINIKGRDRIQDPPLEPQGFSVVCSGNMVYCNGVGTGIRSQCDDHLIVGNLIDDPGGAAISLDASGGARNSILDNYCYGTNRQDVSGIFVAIGAAGTLVQGNYCYNFAANGLEATLSAEATADDCTIANNKLLGCAVAIRIDHDTGQTFRRMVIKGNVGRNVTGSTTGIGLQLAGTAAVQHAIITDNHFTGYLDPVLGSQSALSPFIWNAATMPTKLVFQGNSGWEVQTTDATAKIVFDRIMGDNMAVLCKTRAIARSTSTPLSAYFERGALVRRTGGGAAVVDGNMTGEKVPSTSGWDQTIVASSSSKVIVRVIGAAATNITWEVFIDIVSV